MVLILNGVVSTKDVNKVCASIPREARSHHNSYVTAAMSLASLVKCKTCNMSSITTFSPIYFYNDISFFIAGNDMSPPYQWPYKVCHTTLKPTRAMSNRASNSINPQILGDMPQLLNDEITFVGRMSLHQYKFNERVAEIKKIIIASLTLD